MAYQRHLYLALIRPHLYSYKLYSEGTGKVGGILFLSGEDQGCLLADGGAAR